MPYVVKCQCGAISGCLPVGHAPPSQERISPAQIEASKTCCQCGKKLDSSKAYMVQGRKVAKTREHYKFELLGLT